MFRKLDSFQMFVMFVLTNRALYKCSLVGIYMYFVNFKQYFTSFAKTKFAYLYVSVEFAKHNN